MAPAAGASSSTNDASQEAILGAVKETGRESIDQEVRSDDLKLSDGAAIPEKLPEVQVEGEPLVSPMTLGAILALACDLAVSESDYSCCFCSILVLFYSLDDRRLSN